MDYRSVRISDARGGRWHAPPEIRFATVATPAGNGRWLFVCICGRRCAVLYSPEGGERKWRCRICHGLTYPSQRLAAHDRAALRAHNIRSRVEDGVAKRNRLHWSTFERAQAEADRHQEIADAFEWQQLLRILPVVDDLIAALKANR